MQPFNLNPGLLITVGLHGNKCSCVEDSELRLLGRTHIGQKAEIGSATARIRRARFGKTQMPIHRQANFLRILVILPIVFPPAHRAQLHRVRRIKGSISAAGAAKTHLRRLNRIRRLHKEIDALCKAKVDTAPSAIYGVCRLFCTRIKKGSLTVCMILSYLSLECVAAFFLSALRRCFVL
jgi:hypothetical protein